MKSEERWIDMKSDELNEYSKKVSDVLKYIDGWDLKDQMLYLIAIDNFFNEIRPIIDKYDPGKPKRFIMKRLDEQ